LKATVRKKYQVMKYILFLSVSLLSFSTLLSQTNSEKASGNSGAGWFAVLVVLGLVFMCFIAAILAYFFKKPKKSILDWSSYFLGKLGNGMTQLVAWMMSIYMLPAALVIVYGIAYFPLRWGQTHLNPVLYNTMIALSFVYFSLVIWYVSRKKFYLDFKKTGIGVFFPLMIIIGLVMVGVTCFAAFTGALSDGHTIKLNPALPSGDFGPLLDFYIWHFCKLIPQINVAETLNWDNKYKYESAGVGWLVLIFKALMAYIVLERIFHWNKWRKEERKEIDEIGTAEIKG
jgi:hypothetical protein